VCLAVPGRVCALHDEDGLRLATVDFGGVRKRVCVETLPDVALGAWVLVHAGIALQQIDADAAAESLRLLAEATALAEQAR
jgi:hydrogenase expression/formation protein HypC